MGQRALVLFGHGARDARWAEPFRRLQQIIRSQQPQLTVELGFLELMNPRLPDLVADLVRRGCDDVTIVPVFLGQGGHVLRDLPVLTDQLRLAHPSLKLHVVPAVGESDAVLSAIAAYCLNATQS